MNLGEEAKRRALSLDRVLSEQVRQLPSVKPTRVFLRLRAYLEHQGGKLRKTGPDFHGLVSIYLGPGIDKGPTTDHFVFDSGAHLSFWLTVRETGSGFSLVAYRFHYSSPAGSSPAFLRFDLNRQAHNDPLTEPRCHLHPGLDDVRLPLPVLDPLEVLDRIFFVIEPALLST